MEEIPFWWQENTKCPNCKDSFSLSTTKYPRLCPCGHTLCEQCLDEVSVCAVCKKEVGGGGEEQKEGEGKKKKAGKEYPPSFYIAELLEKNNPKIDPSLPSSLLCDKCNKQEATGSCQLCTINLCDSCWSDVHSFGPFRAHAKTIPTSLVDRKCSLHINYPRDLVCIQENCPQKGKLICIMCERSSHKSHATEPCESVAPSARKILHSQLTNLYDHMAEVNLAMANLQLTMNRISEESQLYATDPSLTRLAEAKDQIRECFRELHSELDKRQDQLIRSLETKVVEKDKILREQRTGFQSFLSSAYDASDAAIHLLHNPDQYAFMEQYTTQSASIHRIHCTKLSYAPCVDDDLGLTLSSEGLIQSIRSFGNITSTLAHDTTHPNPSNPRLSTQKLYEAPPLFQQIIGNYTPTYNGNDVTFTFPDRSTQSFCTAEPIPANAPYYFEVTVLKSEGCFGYFGIVSSQGPVRSGAEFYVVLSDSSRQNDPKFSGLKRSTIVITNGSVYPSPYSEAVAINGPIGSNNATHGFLLDRSARKMTWYVNGVKIGQVPLSDALWYVCVGMWCCKTHNFLVRLNLPIPK